MADRRRMLIVSLLALAAALAYLPDAGHGFVKDDFGWIARSHLASFAGVVALFRTPGDFFRPVVGLSFALDRAIGGLQPIIYGWTNVALLFGCALGVFALARALDLPAEGAIAAAALWLFNWDGIRMAVLWISGRTALLLVLFATLGAAAALRRRWGLAGVLLLLAMLSKEEAVLVPAVIIAWG
ncbi:MAG: hypothetical protein KGN76_14270, partial [Acidobacteriota bacterium]|nr:hypothetical protein [Acidobacteriota bacterium]